MIEQNDEGNGVGPQCPLRPNRAPSEGLLNTLLTSSMSSIHEDEVFSCSLATDGSPMSSGQLAEHACTPLLSSWSVAQRQGRRAEVRF